MKRANSMSVEHGAMGIGETCESDNEKLRDDESLRRRDAPNPKVDVDIWSRG
jgi:hypothetical protein